MGDVRVEVEGSITTIWMNRPDRRNAVDRGMAAELRAAFEAFEADPGQRVAILAGSGGTFCAGADLTAVNDPDRLNELDPDGGGSGPMGPTRMRLGKPLIAAISGYAVAGGLELALLADLRVVESDAVMGVFCRRWGVPLIDGGTVRLPRIIGLGRALDLILTGRPVTAGEALAIGLAPGAQHQGARQLAIQLDPKNVDIYLAHIYDATTPLESRASRKRAISLSRPASSQPNGTRSSSWKLTP